MPVGNGGAVDHVEASLIYEQRHVAGGEIVGGDKIGRASCRERVFRAV